MLAEAREQVRAAGEVFLAQSKTAKAKSLKPLSAETILQSYRSGSDEDCVAECR